MAGRYSALNSKIIFLIAPHFREGPVVFCLDRLRDSGIPVSLVSLTSGLVSSFHGLAVRADCSLEQVPRPAVHRMVIIPDGRECLMALLIDPRVHRLIQETIKQGGMIAAMPVAEIMLRQHGLLPEETESLYVLQRDSDLDEFSDRLINVLMG